MCTFHTPMQLCKVYQKKLVGSSCSSALFSIENNCIVVFWYHGQDKVEAFYNLDDLEVERMESTEVLSDRRKRIQIEIPRRKEEEHKAPEQEDIFFDFEPQASQQYERGDFETPCSFPKRSTLRYLEE